MGQIPLNEARPLSIDTRGEDMDQTPLSNRSRTHTFVGAEALLEILFKDEASRPSLRWLRELQAKRLIPFRKIGRRVFFCPDEVRRSFDAQFKVDSIG